MYSLSPFGQFLKEKRLASGLRQLDLANAIGKSVQFISNIENGKNNSPSQSSDIENLIKELKLSIEDSALFREKASADRNQLPQKQMNYLLKNKSLLELIRIGEEKKINEKFWNKLLNSIKNKENITENEKRN